MTRLLAGVFAILLVWWSAWHFELASRQILPAPLDALKAVVGMFSSGKIEADLRATGKRWGLGFIIGVLAGAPIGLVMGYFRLARVMLDFPVDFFRSLPVTALFPVYLLAFGIQDASKIAMVATAVAFVMIVTACYGIQQAPRTRQHMAHVFGAPPWRRFVDVSLPDALGHIVTGMRVSLGTSLVVVVVSEMFIGASTGIGQRLYDSYSINAVADMYGLLVIAGTFGYALNVVFLWLERRFVFWIGK